MIMNRIIFVTLMSPVLVMGSSWSGMSKETLDAMAKFQEMMGIQPKSLETPSSPAKQVPRSPSPTQSESSLSSDMSVISSASNYSDDAKSEIPKKMPECTACYMELTETQMKSLFNNSNKCYACIEDKNAPRYYCDGCVLRNWQATVLNAKSTTPPSCPNACATTALWFGGAKMNAYIAGMEESHKPLEYDGKHGEEAVEEYFKYLAGLVKSKQTKKMKDEQQAKLKKETDVFLKGLDFVVKPCPGCHTLVSRGDGCLKTKCVKKGCKYYYGTSRKCFCFECEAEYTKTDGKWKATHKVTCSTQRSSSALKTVRKSLVVGNNRTPSVGRKKPKKRPSGVSKRPSLNKRRSSSVTKAGTKKRTSVARKRTAGKSILSSISEDWGNKI